MKKLIPLFILAISPQVFSCVTDQGKVVCVGHKVFKDTFYEQGAIVVGENRFASEVTVQSVKTQKLAIERVSDLAVTNTSLEYHRAGDLVFKKKDYAQGATVEAVNPSNGTVVVRSVKTSKLAVEDSRSLESTLNCLESICPTKTVYKDSEYTVGATVRSINFSTGLAHVVSNKTGNIFEESVRDLYVTEGCVLNVCVAQLVSKRNEYSQGAVVLAVNLFTNRVVVRSVSSGNLFTEEAHELYNQRTSDPTFPRDPSRDPREEPKQPREPREPSRPPRQPTQPEPRRPLLITVDCTVDRLDPAGTLIATYSKAVSGPADQGSYLRGQACTEANRDCLSDTKGRQSCQTRP